VKKKKWKKQTDIQALVYCLNKDKEVKTWALVYFRVTIAKSTGSSVGCKVVVKRCISIINRDAHIGLVYHAYVSADGK